MNSILIIFSIVVIDQITKRLALNLKDNTIIIIKNKLKLVYVENRGAAWGIFQEKRLFLSAITLIVLLVMIYILIKNINLLSRPSIISLSFIIGGAIGNFIDRLFRGYVIDFISYEFFNGYQFPVFNIADIFVVLGCFLLIIAIFKTDDFKEFKWLFLIINGIFF